MSRAGSLGSAQEAQRCAWPLGAGSQAQLCRTALPLPLAWPASLGVGVAAVLGRADASRSAFHSREPGLRGSPGGVAASAGLAPRANPRHSNSNAWTCRSRMGSDELSVHAQTCHKVASFGLSACYPEVRAHGGLNKGLNCMSDMTYRFKLTFNTSFAKGGLKNLKAL